MYYKNVYVFIKRFKNMTPIRGMEKFRTVFPQCFKKSVFIWHFIEIFERNKCFYRTVSFEKWYDIFITRFKKRIFMALIKMQSARYIMTDAKNKKNFKIYVQNVICYVKTVNFILVFNQLIMAWNNLNWKFRFDISEFTADTISQQFLQNFDVKSNMWFEMARHRGFFTSFKNKNRKSFFNKQNNQWKRNQRDFRINTKFNNNKNDFVIFDLLNFFSGARINRFIYIKKMFTMTIKTQNSKTTSNPFICKFHQMANPIRKNFILKKNSSNFFFQKNRAG